jgi:uncharacterized protein YceK
MKKLLISVWVIVLLSGCATYKFQKGAAPHDKGYVVIRNGSPILEYTNGKDGSVPDLALARERFQRRKKTVEYYYAKMGKIESRAKQMLWDPPALLFDFVVGMVKLPFTAYANRKYEKDPQYREKVKREEAQKDAIEANRLQQLQSQLSGYIAKDLAREQALEVPVSSRAPVLTEKAQQPEQSIAPVVPVPPPQTALETTPPSPEKMVTPEPPPKPIASPQQVTSPSIEKSKQTAVSKVTKPNPTAIIIAKPNKGFSPLTVRFSGSKSYAPGARIISYQWDFGDGTTSTRRNPTNTFWSTTMGSVVFEVTLTVTDSRGKTAVSRTTVEVMTK